MKIIVRLDQLLICLLQLVNLTLQQGNFRLRYIEDSTFQKKRINNLRLTLRTINAIVHLQTFEQIRPCGANVSDDSVAPGGLRLRTGGLSEGEISYCDLYI